ncbi:MAG: preprotein translocase subunit SecE, partial [Patescibacteria group bacterium]
SQVVRDTLLVIIASAVTAVFLGTLDFGLQSLLKEATQLDRSGVETATPVDSTSSTATPQE